MSLKNIAILGAVTLILTLSACGGKEQRLIKHYEKGVQHFAAGDYEKARVEFKNVLQMDPKHAAASYSMGQSFERLGDVRSAVGFYQKTLELDPTHIEAKTRLARVYVTSGAHEAAAPLADDLLAVNPSDAAALTVRAGVKAKRGDVAGAETDARAALAAEPNNLDATFLLSSLLNNSNRGEEAAHLLEGAAQRNPNDIALRVVLADIYRQAGKSDQTVATLNELIALEPKQMQHRMRLAQYYASEKKLDDAEKVLRDAVQVDPSNADAKLALVEFLFQQRDAETAKKTLDEFVAAEPANATLKFSQARFASATGKNDVAETIYRSLIDANGVKPDGLKARTELARLLLSQNRAVDVAPLISVVLKESPKDRDALLIRGDMALQNRDAVTAIADYRAVLKDDPTAIPVHKALARAHLLNNEVALAKDSLKNVLMLSENDVDARIQLGMLYQSEGKVAEASAELERARKLAPKSGAVIETLFKTYIAAQDWEKAEEIVKAVAVAAPNTGAKEFFEGILALAQGKKGDATTQFNAALKVRPAWTEPLTAMVSLYVKEKKQAEAVALIDMALKAEPKNAAAHNLKGEVLLSMGKEKAAVAAASFAKAVEAQATFGTAYRNLAMAYLVAGDMAKAEKAYQDGIKATNDSLPLHLGLASFYERQEKFDDAIAAYETALASHGASETVANNLAMLLVAHRGDAVSLDRAKVLVDPLRDTKNPAVLDTIGWVDYKLGNYAAAVPTLELALKSVPSSPLLQFHLGMAQAKQGNAAQAKENLAKALESEVRFHGREEAEAVLAQLERPSG